MRARATSAVAVLVLVALCLPVRPAVAAAKGGSKTAWTELRYRAQKLFLSATTTAELKILPAVKVLPELRTPPQGRAIAPPGPTVAVITLDSDLPFGRREVATAWIDPTSGQVLQSEKRNFGHDLVWKLRRFTAEGVYTWRAEPRSETEESLEPDRWSGVDDGFMTWKEELPEGAVVTEPYALLYLISAARLDRAGSSLKIYLLSHDHLVEVRFTADGLAAEQVHFDEVRAGKTRERVEGVLVRRVTSSARRLGTDAADEDVDVGLLGLKSDLAIAVEVDTGLPVEISGKASGIGTVYVKLKRVVYGVPKPPPAPTPTPNPTPLPDPAVPL